MVENIINPYLTRTVRMVLVVVMVNWLVQTVARFIYGSDL